MMYVEWIEPFADDYPVILRVTIDTAIKHMNIVAKTRGYTYPDNKAALDDFIAVNWASLKEYDV